MLVSQSYLTLCDSMGSLPGSSVKFSGQEYGAGCHFLPQGIFPTQGSKLGLLCFLHRQADSFPLSHQGSPIMAFGLPILREENSSSTFTEIFSAQIFSYVKVAFKMLLR